MSTAIAKIKPNGNRAERRATEQHLRRRTRRTHRAVVRAERLVEAAEGTSLEYIARESLERRLGYRSAAYADLDRFQRRTKGARK
ncbi:hypothetical protein SEA_ZETA1847_27 [Microbacterium phage Zeta1847]|uniref:Uncharacterized protein n=1 Tax=Microbacterium phage Zeta1847 TaxID=2201444 RepID=A0A2Z4Q9C7_9CAUD|nr:hypothetical protein HOT46_gp27 [Microbacterium phage Zeta1847]AWY06661.1 hypothetical protein SEA_ZETA1847_27 [Microbacterium phage Zeta1847]